QVHLRLIRSHRLVGLLTLLFVNTRRLPTSSIKSCTSAEHKLGLNGLLGNKGAVQIRLELHSGLRLGFFSFHLHAGEGISAYEARLRGFHQVLVDNPEFRLRSLKDGSSIEASPNGGGNDRRSDSSADASTQESGLGVARDSTHAGPRVSLVSQQSRVQPEWSEAKSASSTGKEPTTAGFDFCLLSGDLNFRVQPVNEDVLHTCLTDLAAIRGVASPQRSRHELRRSPGSPVSPVGTRTRKEDEHKKSSKSHDILSSLHALLSDAAPTGADETRVEFAIPSWIPRGLYLTYILYRIKKLKR
ncbi:unnamed protein product, partial [Amoebophrya sp. A25]